MLIYLNFSLLLLSHSPMNVYLLRRISVMPQHSSRTLHPVSDQHVPTNTSRTTQGYYPPEKGNHVYKHQHLEHIAMLHSTSMVGIYIRK